MRFGRRWLAENLLCLLDLWYTRRKEDGVELRRRFDARTVFMIVSWSLMIAYLWIGLMPAEATQYVIAGRLEIPSINLSSDVTEMEMVGTKLNTPDMVVGSYSAHKNKTLLVAHSTTAFVGLKDLRLREIVEYGGRKYQVTKMEMKRKGEISMREVLAETELDTVVLMTCAGTLLGGGDATHRLMVTAVAVD